MKGGFLLRIRDDIEEIVIKHGETFHLATRQGNRIATRCGLVAKGISGNTTHFKRVEVEATHVECDECKQAQSILEDVKP